MAAPSTSHAPSTRAAAGTSRRRRNSGRSRSTRANSSSTNNSSNRGNCGPHPRMPPPGRAPLLCRRRLRPAAGLCTLCERCGARTALLATGRGGPLFPRGGSLRLRARPWPRRDPAPTQARTTTRVALATARGAMQCPTRGVTRRGRRGPRHWATGLCAAPPQRPCSRPRSASRRRVPRARRAPRARPRSPQWARCVAGAGAARRRRRRRHCARPCLRLFLPAHPGPGTPSRPRARCTSSGGRAGAAGGDRAPPSSVPPCHLASLLGGSGS